MPKPLTVWITVDDDCSHEIKSCSLKEKKESESEVIQPFWLSVTPWTVTHQAPPSMGFSRQEKWNELPFPSPGDLSDPRIEPRSPAFQEDSLPWKKSNDKPRQCIKKQRHYFADKGPYSQSYGFSSSPVWIWELDNKNCWVLMNWCLWPVVLEKTLESLLDSNEIKACNPKINQHLIFNGRTDAEAETPILGHMMWRTDSFEKTLILGNIEGRRRRGWQRIRR